jgi:hypothetical protein
MVNQARKRQEVVSLGVGGKFVKLVFLQSVCAGGGKRDPLKCGSPAELELKK